MHAADDTPSKNAATRAKHCNFMRQGVETSQCSSRVEEERDEALRSCHSRGSVRRKCYKQHRRCMIRSKTCPKEVIPEKFNRQLAPAPKIPVHSISVAMDKMLGKHSIEAFARRSLPGVTLTLASLQPAED